jgi:Arc/MetJ-type ribon-helix-helix transcriptional regulator
VDREITITVSEEEARRIQDRVDAGEFASPAEFVKAAVSLVVDAEPEWTLPDDVLKRLVEEAVSDPRPSLTPEEVHRQLLELHDSHVAAAAANRAR